MYIIWKNKDSPTLFQSKQFSLQCILYFVVSVIETHTSNVFNYMYGAYIKSYFVKYDLFVYLTDGFWRFKNDLHSKSACHIQSLMKYNYTTL